MRYVISIALMLLLGASQAQAQPTSLSWQGLFIAGDDSIAVFDNSQNALVNVLTARGLATADRYTSTRRTAKQQPDVKLLTDERLDALATQTIAAEGEGCLVHLTSHGLDGHGFYLALGGGTYLDPDDLDALLDSACGEQPTVVLISACYSGQFITDVMQAPNRLILTAAAADRPSFGCSADDTYTYWDGCLIAELPRYKTWGRLYDGIKDCITEKEAAVGAEPSLPQAWFGGDSENWRILR